MIRRREIATKRKTVATPHILLRAVIDTLECRRMLSIVTVNSQLDNDTRDTVITLREAIEIVDGTLAYSSLTAQEQAQVNFTQPLGTNDTINFHCPRVNSAVAITLGSTLPAITKPVTINGYSEGGSTVNTLAVGDNAQIQMHLVGDNLGISGGVGFDLEAGSGGSTIRGFVIGGFEDGGIEIDDSTGSTVAGNFIGLAVNGKTIEANSGAGVFVQAPGSTIGGTTPADRNIIANSREGINVAADSVAVENNYIGTDLTGQAAAENVNSGILVQSGYNVTIGGTSASTRNIISGNGSEGIYFVGAFTQGFSGDVVEGNYIGVAADGKTALANGGDGIFVSGPVRDRGYSSDVTIGVPGAGNVISGNGENGIEFTDSDDRGNLVQANFIGTDSTGLVAVPNTQNGILIAISSSQNTIGGTTVGARNIISGNSSNGVEIDGIDLGSDDEVTNDTVEGNYIGVDATGSTALANTGSGVLIDDAAQGNTIGGTTSGSGNVISGNGDFGVQIAGTQSSTLNTTSNVVEGNTIGTDASGKNAIGDGYAGVYLTLGTASNTIGGLTPNTRNLISGITWVGVWIEGNGSSGGSGGGPSEFTNSNIVEGNYIGTDVTGTAAVTYQSSSGGSGGSRAQYDGDGVFIEEGAYNNTIGGTTAAARNIIAGNLADGVHLYDDSYDDTVEGNYIGTDVTGSKSLGNAFDGVEIDGNNNVIGGTVAGAGNVISGNGTVYTLAGIDIYGGSMNVVQGNLVGTDVTGTAAIGNHGDGVLIESGSNDNTIGGTSIAAQNVIAFNTAAGVVIQIQTQSGSSSQGSTSAGNTVRFNSIFSNSGIGIDLGGDGVTPNDPKDVDTGANDLQNFPVLSTASATSSSVSIAGNFNSVPNTSFILDFYANPTVDTHGNGQGKLYVGSTTVTTDANGNATFNSTFTTAIGGNDFITATATNQSTAPYEDTSEFSAPIIATGSTAVAPTIKSFTVDTGTAQRSRVRTLTLTFNEPVTLDSGAITLTKTSGTATGNVTYTTSTPDGGTTYVITPTSGTSGGSLTDGKYSLVVTPTGVHSSASPSTTMTGSNQTYSFFRLFGDSNGDGTVGLADYRAFAMSYLKSSGSSAYNSIFDVNNDGTVNLIDYRAFAANYLHSITS